MAKTKWPKLPRFFVPLFHSANVYLCRSKEEWEQACIHLGVDSGGNEMLAGGNTVILQYRNRREPLPAWGIQWKCCHTGS